MNFTAAEMICVVASIALNTLFFLLAQCVMIRTLRPGRLLLSSLAVFLVSSILFLTVQFLVVRSSFASASAFVNFGVIVIVGSVGICGLYTFLAPATADRSATAHMLVYLAGQSDWPRAEEIRTAFDGAAFVDKRFAECTDANIICVDEGRMKITDKGRRLARIFAMMLAIYNIQGLPGHMFSFSNN